MKKLIAIAVVLALVAGVAFAQTANGISVNAWGRAAFTPLQYITPHQTNGEIDKGPDGNNVEGESYAGSGITWGGPNQRVDFRVNGNSDLVGFTAHLTADDGVGLGDNANIWVKPFGSDVLKITVGRIIEDTLRGKIGNLDGGFTNFVLDISPEEDAIFGRFGTHGNSVGNNKDDAAFLISSAPVDGLFIGLLVPGALWNWGGPGSGTLAAHAYQYMQLGAGYNIANIGHIRAQYIGGWLGTKDTASNDDMKYFSLSDAGKLASIEFAFALTAVQGLLIDMGAKIGLPLEIKTGSVTSVRTDGIGFSVGATFNSGAFGLGARMDISGLGAYYRADKDNDKSEDGATTVIRVVPTFGLGDWTLGLDVAFGLLGEGKNGVGDKKKNDWSQMGFGAFASRGLGSGSFKAGLSYTLPPNNHDGKANGSGVFQLPIILEYAFF